MTEARRRRLWQLGAVTVFALLIAAVVIAVSRSGSESLQHLPADRAATARLFAGIPQDGQTLGPRGAGATLVEFADLQCPFCREFTTDTLPDVIDRYVRPGKLRVRFMPQTIIGPQSDNAAKAALAAGEQNRLWQFTDLFYRNQDDENSGYVTSEFIRTLFENTPGLNAKQAEADADSPEVEDLLTRSRNLFDADGLSATPTFVLASPGTDTQHLDAAEVLPALEQTLGSG